MNSDSGASASIFVGQMVDRRCCGLSVAGMSDLESLAQAAGIHLDWHDAAGTYHRADEDTLRALLAAIGLPVASAGDVDAARDALARQEAQRPLVTGVIWEGTRVSAPPGPARLELEDGRRFDFHLHDEGDGHAWVRPILEPGYHRLETGGRTITLAIAPHRAADVRALLPAARGWGAAAQLYSLRDSGGFGDARALGDLARVLGSRGAHALAISPIHALFTADPGRPSPYSPSSRRWANPWFADPRRAGIDWPDGDADPPLVDWPHAVAARLDALRQAWDQAGEGTRADVAAFAAAGGASLAAHARFEAIFAHFHAELGAGGWPDWPDDFHDPASPAVGHFAREHQGEVSFHLFLQWLVDASLTAAQDAARASGMAIGLVSDIAVGLNPGGSEAWSGRSELLAGVTLGSPPDAFNARGQEWGITGFNPRALVADGFGPFIETLRAAMRHAGGIRIDHALGLNRLFLVPAGAEPTAGSYVSMPQTDMLRLIALESHRHGAVVVGEDLGTVAPGFREAMGGAGVLGMRVLPFERRWDRSFVPPGEWSADAVALTTTHDLPPIAGWWAGCDLRWRAKLGEPVEGGEEDRAADRARFWAMAREAGVTDAPQPPDRDGTLAADAAIDLVAGSAAPLAIVPMEDLLALDEAPNLPGTIDQHPNWRRRLPLDAAGLEGDRGFGARVARLRATRNEP